MKQLKRNQFLAIILALLLPGIISAQQTVVKATIDSTAILIGEQTMIRLEVAGEKGQPLILPYYAPSDTIMKGIEVVETLRPDTTDLGNNRIQIKQNYLVTSFDSAVYLMPPFEVVSGNDTTYSNMLGLKVASIPVDTESKQFYPIKDVLKPEFHLLDYFPDDWYWWLIGLQLIGLIFYIFGYLLPKRKQKLIRKEKPKLPPHEKAINELNEIKSQKLWQLGKIKEYHSQITDTLRTYIEERFQTPAMEMTSGEILSKIHQLNDAESVCNNLKQILQLADFVKFAKYQPLPDENELSLMNAFLFINQTKIEEKAAIPADGTEKNGEIKENIGNEPVEANEPAR